MLGSFVSLDLIAFFTFFEATLIPMWLLVNNWGGEKRNAAANKFLIYTFAGSMFMLIGMVLLAAQYHQVTGVTSFDIVDIQNQVANGGFWVNGVGAETLVFWTFVVAFLVKAPSFPFRHLDCRTCTRRRRSSVRFSRAPWSSSARSGFCALCFRSFQTPFKPRRLC